MIDSFRNATVETEWTCSAGWHGGAGAASPGAELDIAEGLGRRADGADDRLRVLDGRRRLLSIPSPSIGLPVPTGLAARRPVGEADGGRREAGRQDEEGGQGRRRPPDASPRARSPPHPYLVFFLRDLPLPSRVGSSSAWGRRRQGTERRLRPSL
mmetsp:Transcript_28354/g.64527  ORF Transcript_28354/g.64527 Transcript_28354/m.64527 type:complete len:155 (-) Transcript_28354:318-782(-)